MADRLTEIKARVAMGYVHDSWPIVVSDLEFALREMERLTNVAGTYQKQYYDCANERDRLRAAVSFCRDIATEEYDYQGSNVGAECALRHIIEKCDAALEGKP